MAPVQRRHGRSGPRSPTAAVPGNSPRARAAILQLLPLPLISKRWYPARLMRRPANDRGRWHADNRHETFWTFHPRQAKSVVMAVHDKLGAHAADQSRETGRVDEAAPELRSRGLWRMVQHHDADEPAPAGFGEKPPGGLQLAAAQISRRDEQRRGNPRRQADQGHLAADPQIREPLAVARLPCDPRREGAGEIRHRDPRT